MGRSKAPPPIAPDAPLGMTYSEIFALPQLQMQLTAIVVVHLFLAWSLPKWKNGPFAVKPQTAAHLAPFITCFTWMAYQGVSLWLFDPVIADPSFDRKFGEHAGAQTLIVSMLAIQLYDVPTSIIIPEMRELTFILHHIVVLILGFAALRFRAMYYYGVYFFGVIESSSPLLALVDTMRDFPKLGAAFPVLNEVARVGFAITFFTVRIICWVPVSYEFWRDMLSHFKADAPLHGMPLSIVAFWLATHFFISMLQVHWGLIIVKAAIAMAKGDLSARENEAKGA